MELVRQLMIGDNLACIEFNLISLKLCQYPQKIVLSSTARTILSFPMRYPISHRVKAKKNVISALLPDFFTIGFNFSLGIIVQAEISSSRIGN